MPETRVGCKYCDSGTRGIQYPREHEGFLVCNGCGAEWSGCKIEYEVSDRELAWERKEMLELEAYEHEWED